MNAKLEFPLETLAFNYLSFGFFTALITAVVGFWRIKASSTFPRGDFSGAPSSSSPTPTLVTSSLQQVNETVSNESLSAVTTMIWPLSNEEVGTKGKLTVYYKQDDGGECEGNEEGIDQEGEDNGIKLCEELFVNNWEKLLKMRNGEMEWYCYQDMKIIDGSVVRLWDSCRPRREVEKTAFSVSVISAW
ncbi:uncharacterized protein LOC132617896 isoform X1 [Lycium barbarum]|uniref:uncharacterized protein LOC132617896 isoform X1 n=1 Tax=Lycium barbarum TaxID=112863 RepID=UPI00293EEF13|nr:uncharacterized protein LOC132617896 isoform X1 [Lycium barbarum]